MSLPKIAISIITYNRERQFHDTMESIIKHVVYPKDLITLVIADDKSDKDYVSDYNGVYGHTVIIRQPERSGMPKNWNSALREAAQHGTYTACWQDDWRLTEPLDLRLAIRFLQANQEYGFVRFHKIAGHVGLPCVVKQWNTKQSGVIGYVDSKYDYDPSLMTYFELMPPFDGSNTYSPYSGGVHLRDNGFTEFFGEYEEGLKFSHAELLYFEKVNNALRENLNICPRFVQFPHYVQSRLEDISGGSYRDTPTELETLKK